MAVNLVCKVSLNPASSSFLNKLKLHPTFRQLSIYNDECPPLLPDKLRRYFSVRAKKLDITSTDELMIYEIAFKVALLKRLHECICSTWRKVCWTQPSSWITSWYSLLEPWESGSVQRSWYARFAPAIKSPTENPNDVDGDDLRGYRQQYLLAWMLSALDPTLNTGE